MAQYFLLPRMVEGEEGPTMNTKKMRTKLWAVAAFSLLTSISGLRMVAKEGGGIGKVEDTVRGGNPDGGGTVGGPQSSKLMLARGGTIGRSSRSSGGGTIG